MKTVKIVDYSGTIHLVQVEDCIFEEMRAMDEYEKRLERREERHRAKLPDGAHKDPDDYSRPGDVTDLVDTIITLEEQRVLYDAIAKLKPSQRRRVYMYMMSMTYAEIAREENMDGSSTRKALLRSFKKIRRLLDSLS